MENIEMMSYGYALALIDETMIINGDNPRDEKFNSIRMKSAIKLSKDNEIRKLIREVINNGQML